MFTQSTLLLKVSGTTMLLLLLLHHAALHEWAYLSTVAATLLSFA